MAKGKKIKSKEKKANQSIRTAKNKINRIEKALLTARGSGKANLEKALEFWKGKL